MKNFIQTDKTRKIIKMGVILFMLTILFFLFIGIRSNMEYTKGNSYDYQKMLANPIYYWFIELKAEFILSFFAGVIVLIIYGFNLMLLHIYNSINLFILKIVFWLSLPIAYVIIYISFLPIMIENLGSVLILLFIFTISILSYIGLILYATIITKILKKYKKQKEDI